VRRGWAWRSRLAGRRLRSRWTAVAGAVLLAGALTTGPAHAGYSPGNTCAGNANSVGISLYCLSGNTGFVFRTLTQRFPGMDWTGCVDHEIPPGMRPPADQRDRPGEYWLQACLENVDFDSFSGGDDIQVTLGFHFVEEGQRANTYNRLNDLERAVWDNVSNRNYPVPFMTAFPTHVPRVNVPTFFHFKWMEFDGPEPTEIPEPEVVARSGDASLTARSVQVIVDPQIDGIEPKRCGPNPPKYLHDEEPDPDVQESDCFITFEHSSAAAEELTTSDVPLPDMDDDYPLPVYLLKVTVRWHAVMEEGGQTRDLGTNDFVAYQALPVTEVLGNAGLGL
jgi:hypothetical protein